MQESKEWSVRYKFMFGKSGKCLEWDHKYSKINKIIAQQQNSGLCEVTYLYISGISNIPKQSECNVNSYNNIYIYTIAICTCECPDLMKQLIVQGYGIFTPHSVDY